VTALRVIVRGLFHARQVLRAFGAARGAPHMPRAQAFGSASCSAAFLVPSRDPVLWFRLDLLRTTALRSALRPLPRVGLFPPGKLMNVVPAARDAVASYPALLVPQPRALAAPISRHCYQSREAPGFEPSTPRRLEQQCHPR